MSRNNQDDQGVQQTKGALEDLRGIHHELQRIQQRGQQGRGQQQQGSVSGGSTSSTSNISPSSRQSINQREFFPPLGSTSSTSVDNRQGGNYLYQGVNRGRSLRQQRSASFEPTSSTSVVNQQEQYDYFNDPTITQEVRIINREVRDIGQARAREANPNLDLEKWLKDYEARMRRLSFNRRNSRLGNASNNIPIGLTSSTSSANDSARLNGPDQNVEQLGGNLVTNNVRIDESLRRTNAPATRGEKRGRQQQQQPEQEQPDRKRRRNEKGNTNP